MYYFRIVLARDFSPRIVLRSEVVAVENSDALGDAIWSMAMLGRRMTGAKGFGPCSRNFMAYAAWRAAEDGRIFPIPRGSYSAAGKGYRVTVYPTSQTDYITHLGS